MRPSHWHPCDYALDRRPCAHPLPRHPALKGLPGGEGRVAVESIVSNLIGSRKERHFAAISSPCCLSRHSPPFSAPSVRPGFCAILRICRHYLPCAAVHRVGKARIRSARSGVRPKRSRRGSLNRLGTRSRVLRIRRWAFPLAGDHVTAGRGSVFAREGPVNALPAGRMP
jgi:hypothetical protein